MLELRRNFYVIRRWWWLLIAAAIVGGLVAYGATKLLVKQQYEATSVVSVAPPPQGPSGLSVTMLSAAADAQLIGTWNTAQSALSSLPPSSTQGITVKKISSNITGESSPEGQLLLIHVKWTDSNQAMALANAVARTFISQERVRLQGRYNIVHRGLSEEQAHLAQQVSAAPSGGWAQAWLQSQYADASTRLYQEDADARVQLWAQQNGLQLAQPAVDTVSVGPRASLNAALGAVLALLIAAVFAFASTTYDSEDAPVRPVLARVGE